MQKQKANPREAVKIIAALVCVLGMGFAEIAIVGKYFLLPFFGSADRGLNVIEIIIMLVAVFVAFFVGSIIGVVCWAIIMRPFITRQEAEAYLTQPYIPVFTAICRKIFNLFYKNSPKE